MTCGPFLGAAPWGASSAFKVHGHPLINTTAFNSRSFAWSLFLGNLKRHQTEMLLAGKECFRLEGAALVQPPCSSKAILGPIARNGSRGLPTLFSPGPCPLPARPVPLRAEPLREGADGGRKRARGRRFRFPGAPEALRPPPEALVRFPFPCSGGGAAGGGRAGASRGLGKRCKRPGTDGRTNGRWVAGWRSPRSSALLRPVRASRLLPGTGGGRRWG